MEPTSSHSEPDAQGLPLKPWGVLLIKNSLLHTRKNHLLGEVKLSLAL